MREQYKVIDTNVFLSDASALDSFQPKKQDTVNHLVVPLQALVELDSFAGESSERGADSRAVLRRLKEMREQFGGTLYSGINLGDGRVLVSSAQYEAKVATSLASVGSHHDLRVLQVAQNLKDLGKDVELITNDLGALDIADGVGLSVSTWRDFEAGMPASLNEAYKGWRYVDVDYSVIDDLKSKGTFAPGELSIEGLLPNEFVILRGRGVRETPLVFDAGLGRLKRLHHYNEDSIAVPKDSFRRSDINSLQQCYIHALMDPAINIVFAIGVAGSSKTFWAAYAGVAQTFSAYGTVANHDPNAYKKLLITHPNVPAADSDDIGFLPGDLEEKLSPWFASVNDQLEQIWDAFGITDDEVEDFKGKGDLEVLALVHARGRTFPKRFWIIDEAQNVTRPQLRTLITRIGSDSKVVLTGDPRQCDLKGVTAVKNTIVWANEMFRDYEKSATLFFPDVSCCVRSELAREALTRLF